MIKLEEIEEEGDKGILQKLEEGRYLFKKGISGWVDDGANFRLTFEDGLITAVANSTAGGHS